ncbi:T9SS type A sorting domain-containing protein [candidate division GN15 bacterium]|nr:T9SS type A sorting domain-containing protein [candidate division GN15 bacterium]
MKDHRIPKRAPSLLFFFFVLIVSQPALAQAGRWVEHDLDDYSSTVPSYESADGLIIVSAPHASHILLFDISMGTWLNVDLGTPQTHSETDYRFARGDIAMFFSDSLIFGYSAELGVWDTTSYSGSVLGSHVLPSRCSFGCSDRIAYFATDQYLYIFDAAVGEWTSHSYGLPAGFTYGQFWAKDDYFAMILHETYPTPPKSVVYSAHTQSFNSMSPGGYYLSPTQDHGYACQVDLGDNNYCLVGYSAFDNDFDTIHVHLAEVTEGMTGGWISNSNCHEYTTYLTGHRIVVTPSVSVTCTFYGYDTYLGYWTDNYIVFDWDTDLYYGNGVSAGRYSVDNWLERDTDYWRFMFYRGYSGTYLQHNTDIAYKSSASGYTTAGRALVVYDSTRAWGYDVETNLGKYTALTHSQTKNFRAGDNWVVLTRYDTGEDAATVYAYYANNDSWQSHGVDGPVGSDMVTADHYLVDVGDNYLFYSGLTNTFAEVVFPGGVYPYAGLKNNLGYVRTDSLSYVHDATRGTIHQKNFAFQTHSLGDNSLATFNATDSTLHGYSVHSGNWSEMTIDVEPYTVADTGSIGLVTGNIGAEYYARFYAFNGLDEGWVALDPAGTHRSFAVAAKTAVVLRDNRVYAFDPYHGLTSVDDDEPAALPRSFTVSQNYPNPFNMSTVIEFTVPYRADVTVDVLNILGQRVATLMNGSQVAGEYQVTWDGRNTAGHEVASGVYFYRVVFDDIARTKKMVLLK